MGRVLGIHEVTLRPGVSADEFERFVADFSRMFAAAPGWSACGLKGFRGRRIGEYILLLEVEDEEAFERFYPLGPGDPTEATRELRRAHAREFDRYNSLVEEDFWTDYLPLEAQLAGH